MVSPYDIDQFAVKVSAEPTQIPFYLANPCDRTISNAFRATERGVWVNLTKLPSMKRFSKSPASASDREDSPEKARAKLLAYWTSGPLDSSSASVALLFPPAAFP
jgi:hypothetical protein